jgi:hypothetical protein
MLRHRRRRLSYNRRQGKQRRGHGMLSSNSSSRRRSWRRVWRLRHSNPELRHENRDWILLLERRRELQRDGYCQKCARFRSGITQRGLKISLVEGTTTICVIVMDLCPSPGCGTSAIYLTPAAMAAFGNPSSPLTLP